jgi:hypothetical protein
VLSANFCRKALVCARTVGARRLAPSFVVSPTSHRQTAERICQGSLGRHCAVRVACATLVAGALPTKSREKPRDGRGALGGLGRAGVAAPFSLSWVAVASYSTMERAIPCQRAGSERRSRRAGVAQMTQELRTALLQQREAFRKKFGRDMGLAIRCSSIPMPKSLFRGHWKRWRPSYLRQ